MSEDRIQWRSSLENARVEARHSGKLVLIELFSPKCIGCQGMEKLTFSAPIVVRLIEQYFVPVHFNVLEKPEILKQYSSPWTPTLIVQDTEGNEQRRSVGYLSAERFRGEMALARVFAALNRKDYQVAKQLSTEAVEQTHGDSLREPEAYYWLAVSTYKASEDQSGLMDGWNLLLDKFPSSEWAKRAEVIRQLAPA